MYLITFTYKYINSIECKRTTQKQNIREKLSEFHYEQTQEDIHKEATVPSIY